MVLFWLVLGLLAGERLVELAISRRNQRRLLARGATLVEPDGFGLILAVHVGLFPALVVEHLAAPWAGTHPWTWPLLGLALAAQVLRYWVIGTLGERWATRVLVLPGEPPVARGPYRFLAHPNYAAIVLELAVLPLAFGLFVSAAAHSLVNAVALRRRIRVENAALRAATEDRQPPPPA